uniref:G-protein coupled receptors family 1 profile domain-containing protein n=1 Tax=Tetranychus urticae TaxID=32264 RepID=T1KQ09_TETUR
MPHKCDMIKNQFSISVRAFFSHHVTRSIHSISAICWGIPLTAFTIYFYSIPCQGFRSINCDYDFLASKRYRLFILSFFAIPLVLMFFLYTRIFKIIRQNQQMRCQSRHGCVSESSFPKAAAMLIQNGSKSTPSSKHVLIFRQCPKPTESSTSSISSSTPITFDPQSQSVETSIDPADKVNYIRVKSIETVNSLPPSQPVKHSTSPLIQSNGSTLIQSKESLNKLITMDENVSNEVPIGRQSINSKKHNDSTNQPHHKILSKVKDNRLTTVGPTRTNTKALITSLLILGTYLLCWVPAVTFLVLTCQDGCPFSIFAIPRKIVIIISSICNLLVIMKAIVDPFIYIFRIREVKLAIRKIFNPNQRNDGSHCNRSTITGSTSGGSTANSTNRSFARERLN